MRACAHGQHNRYGVGGAVDVFCEICVVGPTCSPSWLSVSRQEVSERRCSRSAVHVQRIPSFLQWDSGTVEQTHRAGSDASNVHEYMRMRRPPRERRDSDIQGQVPPCFARAGRRLVRRSTDIRQGDALAGGLSLVDFWSPLVDRQADRRMEPTHEQRAACAEHSGPAFKVFMTGRRPHCSASHDDRRA